MMHAISLDGSQFGDMFYEHSHISCAFVSCNYCYSFDYDAYTYLLLGRPSRLEALTAFNGNINLQSLLKTSFSLGFPTLRASSYDDLFVRSEALISLGKDYYDDKPHDDLDVSSDSLSPLQLHPS